MVKAASGLEREKIAFNFNTSGKISTSDDIVPNSWTLDNQRILSTHQTVAGQPSSTLVPADGTASTPLLPGTGEIRAMGKFRRMENGWRMRRTSRATGRFM